jgi:hypothetical protein
METSRRSVDRYLGYLYLASHGHCDDLSTYRSLADAHAALARRIKGPFGPGYGEGSYLNLYRITDDEMIAAAEEFHGIGCPFDVPDYRLTLGPRGGMLLERG